MWSVAGAGRDWYTATNKDEATVFNFVTGDTQDRGFSYKLSKTEGWFTVLFTRYFNVDVDKTNTQQPKPRANSTTSSLSLLNRKRLTAHILRSTKKQVN